MNDPIKVFRYKANEDANMRWLSFIKDNIYYVTKSDDLYVWVSGEFINRKDGTIHNKKIAVEKAICKQYLIKI